MMFLFLVLLFQLSSVTIICKNETLVESASGNYPPNQTGFFAPNQICSFLVSSPLFLKLIFIQISVPKGKFVSVAFSKYNMNKGDSVFISNNADLNTSYSSGNYVKPLCTSPVDLSITYTVSNSTNSYLYFSWDICDLPTLPYRYQQVRDQEFGPIAFGADDFRSNILVIQAIDAATIYAGKGRIVDDFNGTDPQVYFIYSGVGTNGTFLGTVYDVLLNGSMTLKANETITIIANLPDISNEFCLLIKLASETQGLDYNIGCFGVSMFAEYTLDATKKPQAFTVISRADYTDVVITNIKFSDVSSKVDVLPGAATPPFKPLLSFGSADWTNTTVEQYVPGLARTFYVKNGVAKITLESVDDDAVVLTEGVNATGVIPLKNYLFSGYPQRYVSSIAGTRS